MAKQLQYRRLLLLGALLGGAFAVLACRLVEVQVIRHEELLVKAEHVRKIFLAMDIEHFGTRLLTTLSIGVAVYPRHGRSGEEVLKAVDDALYAAKDAGRNCTRKAT